MRIAFLGSGEFGLPTLERLIREHDVGAIVTQPDRPAGRRRQLTPTPIGAWALEHAPGTALLKPPNVNEPEIASQLAAHEIEALVIIAFGQKLGPDLLADRFACNLHASLLPRWRGAAPIARAIMAGDAESGNSVITIAPRMDAGDILAQGRRVIAPGATAGDLHDQLAADGPELILDVLDHHRAGALRPQAQDEALVTLAPKLSRAEAWVDFAQPADLCRCRINGLSPWPGVEATLSGARLKLIRAEAEPAGPSSEQDSWAPGVLVDASRGLVACGGGTSLTLIEVQPNGKRVMTWKEFAQGRTIEAGAKLEPVLKPS